MNTKIDILNTLIPNMDINMSLLNIIKKDYSEFNYNYKLNKIKLKKRYNKKINFNEIKTFLKDNFIIEKTNKLQSNCNSFYNSNILDKINKIKFISEDGKKEIDKLEFNLKLDWYTDDLSVYYDIYFYNKNDILIFLKNMNTLIKSTIFLYKNINLNTNNNNLFCHFFLTNLKKKINWNKRDILDINNINSAVTSKKYIKVDCDNDNLILIWRKEEFLKVYLHELVHFFDIDLDSIKHKGKNNNKIIDKFCVDSNIKLIPNEAITDFIAILINCVIYSTEKNTDLNNIFQNEIKFSLFQSIKILKYYGFKNWNDFYNNNNCNIHFSQNTSVFSYYILKSILFLYYNDTILMLKSININDKYSLNFNYNKDSYSDIINYLIESFKKDDFSKIFEKINLITFDINHNKNLINTMRMTLYDYIWGDNYNPNSIIYIDKN